MITDTDCHTKHNDDDGILKMMMILLNIEADDVEDCQLKHVNTMNLITIHYTFM